VTWDEDFYYLQTYGARRHPPREALLQYGRAVMIVVGADGEVSDVEMAMFMGIAKASGIPDDVRAAWREFDWRSARLEDCITGISTDPENPGEISLAFLYDAIRISRADGYDQKERAAVARAARTLGISSSAVASIEHLVETEEALRTLRITLLNPALARIRPGQPMTGLR
jgi:tellurite resistance protein